MQFADMAAKTRQLTKLSWRNERRRVSDLTPWADNPRKITDDQLAHLKESLIRFDLADPLIIDTDNRLVGGHQRLQVLMLLGRGGEEVDVRIPSRKLTETEFTELALRLNRNQGEWDWVKLEEFFTTDQLLDIGFELFEFGLHNMELDTVTDIGDDEDSMQRVEFMASPRDKGDLVLFECSMSKANRDVLNDAIREVKASHKVETTEAALMVIINAYRGASDERI